MPKNNKLDPSKQPMKIRFGEKPQTKFKNNLESLKVKLLDCPTMEQLRSYLPNFLEATWSEEPMQEFTTKEKDEIIRECLKGNALPTALETIRLTFLLDGLSLVEVTHILRYRKASFSADCSADKWWTNKDALVPHSIEQNEEFNKRYQDIVKQTKDLYCDMIDSKEVSIMDARYILPRCLETYYFMSLSLMDALHIIRQRIDRSIQPETDNIIAYKMYLEILKQLPIVYDIIDIDAEPKFYTKMAGSRQGKCTNLYIPEENADKFEWNEKDFLYNKKREDFNGNANFNKFKSLYNEIKQEIKRETELAKEKLQKEC